MNEQKKLTPELEKRVQQAVENFMQGYGSQNQGTDQMVESDA